MRSEDVVIFIKRHIKHSLNLPKFNSLERLSGYPSQKKISSVNINSVISRRKRNNEVVLDKLFNNTSPVFVFEGSKQQTFYMEQQYGKSK
jgi:hypothetical protein